MNYFKKCYALYEYNQSAIGIGALTTVFTVFKIKKSSWKSIVNYKYSIVWLFGTLKKIVFTELDTSRQPFELTLH